MTPRGECPACRVGHLSACEDAPGYTRCAACCTTFDHHGNGYDRQWRLVSRRD